MSDPIFVTRPYLPPLAEFLPMLEQIWESRILTNSGPFHARFEAALADHLGAAHVSLVANGTLALALALEAAGLEGEVITTPYSFVATSHVVRMQGLVPVFADIRPSDLNIDPSAIKRAITPRTSAIVGVHCYGNPCDFDAIQTIADDHGLKVIYDAAHAFGVTYKDVGVTAHGDLSTLSFHATKAFNTFEGGAIVTRDIQDKLAVDRLRNFGIADEVTIPGVGTNAKMSEFNAALGLLQLAHIEEVRARRAKVDALYRELFRPIPGIDDIPVPPDVRSNFCYFPILVGEEFPLERDALYDLLKRRGIIARRYFYPLLSTLPMYKTLESANPDNLPIATRTARQILCLPIYPDLDEKDQRRIACVIADAAGGSAR